MIREKLDKLSLSRPLGGGLILTGGGAQLQGAAELAQDIFGLSVRVGSLLPRRGLSEEYRNPSYATAVGLMLEGYDREGAGDPDAAEDTIQRERGDSIFNRIGAWFRNEFF